MVPSEPNDLAQVTCNPARDHVGPNAVSLKLVRLPIRRRLFRSSQRTPEPQELSIYIRSSSKNSRWRVQDKMALCGSSDHDSPGDLTNVGVDQRPFDNKAAEDIVVGEETQGSHKQDRTIRGTMLTIYFSFKYSRELFGENEYWTNGHPFRVPCWRGLPPNVDDATESVSRAGLTVNKFFFPGGNVALGEMRFHYRQSSDSRLIMVSEGTH